MWSRHSRRSVPMKRSAIAFARDAGTGVRMIRMSAPANAASNAAVNLVSRSRIKNRNCSARSPRSMSRLRVCWVTQAPVGWAVIPAIRTRRRSCSITTRTVEAAQEDGVDVGEVDGEDRVGLRGQELSPGRSGPARSRIDAGALEDLPHCRRGDRVAEPDEIAVDSAVAPPWVLPRHPQHQIANALR